MNNILALDIATKTGWATKDASGVWDFKLKRGESEGMKVVRFKSKLREIIKLQEINIIAYERPAGLHASSIITASKFLGILEETAEELGINYSGYSATEIKKHATGKGNVKKDLMIAAAKLKFKHIEIIDDNHADALWLYHMVFNELNT